MQPWCHDRPGSGIIRGDWNRASGGGAFFATEYTFDHLGFEPDYERRVTMRYYEAGHMMYIRRADHAQLKKDIAAFIASASGG